MFDLTKGVNFKPIITSIGENIPDVQIFQDEFHNKESLEITSEVTPNEQQLKQSKPSRMNRSLTNKELFKENSQNFRAKYEDMPLKRPPKYRAPLPKT